MATGASHADIAILLVDARHGAKRQTRRHAAICDLVGIKKVVLAVNKMDAVDWSEARYREIEPDFRAMAGSFNFAQVAIIPVAALTGDNVVHRSARDALVCRADLARASRSRSIRKSCRTTRRSACRCSSCCAPPAISAAMPEPSPRAASGVGERIVDARSGLGATLRRIATMDGDLTSAGKGDAVTLVLDTDLDISRGAVLSEVPRRPANADVIEARLVWLSETPFDPEAGYLLRTATDLTPVTSVSVSALVDFETLGVDARACLQRQRHRRLPHPARPRRGDRPVPRPAAHRQFRAGQRHRRRDRRRRRHHLGAGRRAAGRRQCARARTGSCSPAGCAPISAIPRPISPNSTGVRKRWRFCCARSEFRF